MRDFAKEHGIKFYEGAGVPAMFFQIRQRSLIDLHQRCLCTCLHTEIADRNPVAHIQCLQPLSLCDGDRQIVAAGTGNIEISSDRKIAGWCLCEGT